MTEFTIAEKRLPSIYGIPLSTWRKTRRETSQGSAWVRKPDKTIAYSPEGFETVCQALGVSPKDYFEKKDAGAKPVQKTGRVAKLTRNIRILMASIEGTTGLQRVKVVNNGKFTPGMQIQVTHIQADLWIYTGPPIKTRGRVPKQR